MLIQFVATSNKQRFRTTKEIYFILMYASIYKAFKGFLFLTGYVFL